MPPKGEEVVATESVDLFEEEDEPSSILETPAKLVLKDEKKDAAPADKSAELTAELLRMKEQVTKMETQLAQTAEEKIARTADEKREAAQTKESVRKQWMDAQMKKVNDLVDEGKTADAMRLLADIKMAEATHSGAQTRLGDLLAAMEIDDRPIDENTPVSPKAVLAKFKPEVQAFIDASDPQALASQEALRRVLKYVVGNHLKDFRGESAKIEATESARLHAESEAPSAVKTVKTDKPVMTDLERRELRRLNERMDPSRQITEADWLAGKSNVQPGKRGWQTRSLE